MPKKIVFVDMDGVLADFDGDVKIHIKDPPEMFVPGFFRNLKVLSGAHEAVAELLSLPHLEVYIGSKPTSGNLSSATEKFEWVARHFPRLLKRIVLVCDKRLLHGDYLIDDDKRWQGSFKGKFLHFDKNKPEESWKVILERLRIKELSTKEKDEKSFEAMKEMQEANYFICEIGACIHPHHLPPAIKDNTE